MKAEALKVKTIIQINSEQFVSSQLSTRRTADSSAQPQLPQPGVVSVMSRAY